MQQVLLEGGEKIPADLVIISTGVRANIAVAEDAGLITERAVVVFRTVRQSLARRVCARNAAHFRCNRPDSDIRAIELRTVAGQTASAPCFLWQYAGKALRAETGWLFPDSRYTYFRKPYR